ncbi:adenosylcobinamide-GDP ribazoletransferase [Tranquillimonas alkanivorans]|uniref:Adenosylcobinamide-GDP ribazoletransferase n=1 Tax=Tranquillimonas alkanivorans TaxID=441119 RepID=A0A1I5SKF3_9RHOB|nr:adenosylcobinamide-GDP ribazoletransferase [Tranquillimonas alkanivorans]SFP71199.1 cobalamin-5'-phosphate synthase [Tranquillimonas alkanivorans]
MPTRDIRPLTDLAEALALLTRLPVRASGTRGAEAAWAWPLAGAVVGALAGLVGLASAFVGLPPAVAAGLALATAVVVTGGLHEDGLADAADGLWGGWTRDRRLEIMRDSRIGSYGVLALVLSLGLRWSALTALFAAGHVLWPLLAAGALSRAPMVALAARLPNARGEGLSAATGRPSAHVERLALFVAFGLGFLGTGLALLWPAVAVTLAAFGCARIARAKIGGQTGDILGATQQVGEIAALAALAAVLA